MSLTDLVKIAHDEQQIWGFLDRQKSRPRNVDSSTIVETLHRSSDGSLKRKRRQL